MNTRVVVVDAFADRPFAGNPAAVCVLPAPADETWMRALAREMNLSETAFLHPEADGFRLRWFTPAVEVDLCGHATLASAHVLWESGALEPSKQAAFHTRSGRLTARRLEGGAATSRIELDFPASPCEPCEPPPGLLEALGVTPTFIGSSRDDYLVEVESEAIVRALSPDHRALRSLGLRGAIVTSRAASNAFDFVSRFFAPGAGIDEDPVTGSAHTKLGPHWAARLGKSELVGYQASARGGTVWVHVDGDRVRLAGNAITMFRAELTRAASAPDAL